MRNLNWWGYRQFNYCIKWSMLCPPHPPCNQLCGLTNYRLWSKGKLKSCRGVGIYESSLDQCSFHWRLLGNRLPSNLLSREPSSNTVELHSSDLHGQIATSSRHQLGHLEKLRNWTKGQSIIVCLEEQWRKRTNDLKVSLHVHHQVIYIQQQVVWSYNSKATSTENASVWRKVWPL